MKVAILGYGTVGKGLENLCQQDERFKLIGIYVRAEKVRPPYFRNDLGLIDEADLVFECLSGVQPAHDLIEYALSNGKAVISSNKAVMALHLPEYLSLASQHQTSVQIEACVAGGIPFINALLRLKRLGPITSIAGIFNGTSNYILSAMQDQQLDFDTALKQAQQQGYAEADPSADIDGIDVLNKTILSIMCAYGLRPQLSTFKGIRAIDATVIDFAKKKQKRIIHLALIKQANQVYIGPVLLDEHHYLANVRGCNNAQLITSQVAGQLGYYGAGAGQIPTASSMIQNALELDQVKYIEISDQVIEQNGWQQACVCLKEGQLVVEDKNIFDQSVLALWGIQA